MLYIETLTGVGVDALCIESVYALDESLPIIQIKKEHGYALIAEY